MNGKTEAQLNELKLILSFNLIFIGPYENKSKVEQVLLEQGQAFCMLPHTALIMHLKPTLQPVLT